jgi:NAD(P)H-dependent flavin oxidoreductase YrpB (nitropropane dioxygenase family)
MRAAARALSSGPAAAPPRRAPLPGALAHPALRRLPVIAAPLFIVSVPALVIAQCCAGVVGSVPALNARPEAQLDDWLAEITEALAAHDRAHPGAPAASNPLWQPQWPSGDPATAAALLQQYRYAGDEAESEGSDDTSSSSDNLSALSPSVGVEQSAPAGGG